MATAEVATSDVRIAAVQYDSPGDDTGSNTSLNREWVKLTNYGDKAQWLTGWTLRDPEGYKYKFPELKLKPGKSVTIRTGDGTDDRRNLYADFNAYVWNNSGDKAILKDADKDKVDSCKWGDGGGSIDC